MTDDGGNWGGGRGTQVRATKEIELPGLGDQSLACGIPVAGMTGLAWAAGGQRYHSWGQQEGDRC